MIRLRPTDGAIARGTVNRWRFLSVVLLSAAIVACGGGAPSEATVQPIAQNPGPSSPPPAQSTVVDHRVMRAETSGANDPAGITVVRYELVSSARVSRTVFDYTYRAMLQVEGQNYPSGALLTVRSTSPATTFPDPNVSTGPLVAFSVAEPSDTFTLRQDRNVPFDGDALIWEVSGAPLAAPEPPLGVVAFDFVRDSGREGHKALVPITSSPSVGAHLATLQVSRPVDEATVAFKDPTTGNLLGTYPLQSRIGVTPSVDWIGSVDVPAARFQVEIRAGSAPAAPTSFLFGPPQTGAATALSLTPTRISLWRSDTHGKTLKLEIRNSARPGDVFTVHPQSVAGLSVVSEPSQISLNEEGVGLVDIIVTSDFQSDLLEIHNLRVEVREPGGATANALSFVAMVYPHE